MPTKEELLKELARLGVDPTKRARKPRSDAGQPRGEYKPRSDKGQVRGSYINTAAKYKYVYERMLTGHQSSAEDGADNLTRDKNDLFPPHLNRYYRRYIGKDREYVASVIKPAHLEQARWRWLMAEFSENPEQWREHIAKWYFIDEAEIELWTYTEWAWAYTYGIGGRANRLVDSPIVLKYDNYLAGDYNGVAQFDERGEIKWTNIQ